MKTLVTTIFLFGAAIAMAQQSDLQPPLRDLAARHDLLIGCCVNTGAFRQAAAGDEPRFAALLAEQMSILTAENAMKPKALVPRRGAYDWSVADAMFDFAERHGMQVRFHTGLWHRAVPDWLEGDDVADAERARFVEQHIQRVGQRYADRMTYWDVVNEPIDPKQPDGLRETIWKQALGDDYLHKIYRWAHEAAPDVKLVVNDYGIWNGGRKTDAMYELVKGMLDAGVPVHAVGFQVHLLGGEYPDPDRFEQTLRRFTALGLEVHVTEMDVAISKYDDDLSPEQKLQRQAEVYRRILEGGLRVDGFTVFQTWGLTDRWTWVDNFIDADDAPLLFDEQYQPKPAYFAVREVLAETAAD